MLWWLAALAMAEISSLSSQSLNPRSINSPRHHSPTTLSTPTWPVARPTCGFTACSDDPALCLSLSWLGWRGACDGQGGDGTARCICSSPVLPPKRKPNRGTERKAHENEARDLDTTKSCGSRLSLCEHRQAQPKSARERDPRPVTERRRTKPSTRVSRMPAILLWSCPPSLKAASSTEISVAVVSSPVKAAQSARRVAKPEVSYSHSEERLRSIN